MIGSAPGLATSRTPGCSQAGRQGQDGVGLSRQSMMGSHADTGQGCPHPEKQERLQRQGGSGRQQGPRPVQCPTSHPNV